jgi:hypothetical protein
MFSLCHGVWRLLAFGMRLRGTRRAQVMSEIFFTCEGIGGETGLATGTLHKNRESGIWLKICKIIAIPETEILHSRSLPIFPD